MSGWSEKSAFIRAVGQKQKYFCPVYDYTGKADLTKGCWNPGKKKKIIWGNHALFCDNLKTAVYTAMHLKLLIIVVA